MSWKDALKEYANVKGQYVIPKKGTAEYDEVKAIQAKLASNPQPSVPKTTAKKGKGVKEAFVSVF